MSEESRDLGTATTPDDFLRLRRIFEAALEHPPAERPAFVEQACDGDTALIADVEGMLAVEGRPHQLLDRGAAPDRPPTLTPATAENVCSSCTAPVASSHRFCPSCGTPTVGSVVDEGRFRAGALFAGRFRIVAVLGRGGMGEVYRAHDLELGQPVALKFLTRLRSDDGARARVRREVRLARQISHPNVCRVYDIGDAHGDLYLSMEYVDGEDLAALLKRIGRLPVDKGIDIARQLCAGLAAAHAKGVLHRDFKPANIMIDGAGAVRIMDFGLAALADRIDAADVRSGTPAYMAPEQLAGREATVQSDLYALGLVLYELFTGKPPFVEKTIHDLQQRRESHPSTTPSTLIPEMGPRVEGAILRCLEPDPKRRPASALDVSASLPGGDPVAEALAAGETPSPAMVAASGPTSGLSLRVASSLLAGIGVGLVTVLLLAPKSQVAGRLPFEYPPEVLTEKARDIIRLVGLTQRPVDFAGGFQRDLARVRYLDSALASGKVARETAIARLTAPPFPVVFTYRQDAESLAPRIRPAEFRGWIPLTYESTTGPGAAWVALELDGRLRQLVAFPSRGAAAESSSRTIDWSRLFEAAGLDIDRFTPAEPQPGGSRGNEIIAAWTGTYPGDADLPVRIEAAALQGGPTYFAVVFPWDTEKSTPLERPRAPTAPGRLDLLFGWIFLTLTLLAGVVAYQNWKAGRADLRGAARIGIGMGAALLLVVILGAHDATLTMLYGPAVAWTVFNAAMCAMGYIAFEPWVRRQSPEAMTTWSRVLAGRWHDPVVGRDLLVGVFAAIAVECLRHAASLQLTPAGAWPDEFGFEFENLMGAQLVVMRTIYAFFGGVLKTFEMFLLLFMCRVLLRRKWAAAIAFSVVYGALASLPSFTEGNWVNGAMIVVSIVCTAALMLRFGFLTAAVWNCVRFVMADNVLTNDIGAWYAQSSLIAVIVVGALALYAFRVSVIRRPGYLFDSSPTHQQAV